MSDFRIDLHIVPCIQEFNAIARTLSKTVSLASVSDEAAYAMTDTSLAQRIDEILSGSFGDHAEGVLYHQNYDWWPNHTRSVEIDISCVSMHLLKELHSTLSGEHDNWVVNLQVYDPLQSEESQHVGSINVYTDRLLCTASLIPYVQKTVTTTDFGEDRGP